MNCPIWLAILTLTSASKVCQISQSPAVSITQNNDRSTSYGGWNPNLRSILRAPDNATLLFGTNVMDSDGTNLKAVLNKRMSPTSAWTVAREAAHVVPRINQKDAFIVVGNLAYTYVVNWGAGALEECYFTLTGTGSAACNHVLVSGSVWKPPANSNYIGASVCCSGTGRIIWFTTVGDNGAPGSWTFLANYGGGWNGPFVFSLNTIAFNDFAYVAAYWDPKSTSRMHFVGQGIIGAYANCDGTCFRVAVGELNLGGATKMTILGDASANQQVMTRGAIWVSPHGDVHVIAARLHPKYEMAYYMKPATAVSWGTYAVTQRAVLPAGIVGARIATAGDTMCVHGEHASGVHSYCFYVPELIAGEPLDFANACNHTAMLAAPFANPCAIWTELQAYQTMAPLSLDYAVCGAASAQTDNNVGFVEFKVDWNEPTTRTESTTTTTTTITTTTSSASATTSATTAAETTFPVSTTDDVSLQISFSNRMQLQISSISISIVGFFIVLFSNT